MGHFRETFCEHVSIFTSVRKFLKVLDVVRVEDVADGKKTLIDVGEIFLQLINKHTQWTVYIYLQSIIYVLLHRIWVTIILDDAKRLIRSEKAICAREGLNNVNILHHLVNIQCVHPLRIVASQHLCNHNKQVNPLGVVILNANIWLFMSKAFGNVLLVFGIV